MTDSPQAQNPPAPGTRRPPTDEELDLRIAADPEYARALGARLLEYLRTHEGLGLCESVRGGAYFEPTTMADEQLSHKFVEAALKRRGTDAG